MPRPPRITNPNSVYHVYSRGNNKAETFKSASDYKKFLDILTACKEKFSFSLFHYCLMPNHIHLHLRPNSLFLPKIMHALKNQYSKYFCLKYKFVGHVWQGRYGLKHLKSDADLFACGNYIEMNPVRAGIVKAPEYWPYSSYDFYAKGEPLPLVDEDPFYKNLGFTSSERQKHYREALSKTRSF